MPYQTAIFHLARNESFRIRLIQCSPNDDFEILGVRKHRGKRRKCWLHQHFLLFLQGFLKSSFSGSLKLGIGFSRGSLDYCPIMHMTIKEVQARVSLNPFPYNPWFLRICSTALLKTPWEKEKLLVTSNFSSSHSVFYPFEEPSGILLKFKFSSANSFSLEESKICRLGKG